MLHLTLSHGAVGRPWYAWLALALALFTALPALIVGVLLITDPTGAAVGFPPGLIEATPFRTYLVPGLYLFTMNGLGMLALAALIVRRHPLAPAAAGVLGAGLVIWILVQLLVLPERMVLQAVFLAVGTGLMVISAAWLRGAVNRPSAG